MDIKLASDVMFDSIVDGDGLRATIFTQGCPHGCSGCHNPQTWEYDKGFIASADEVVTKIVKNSLNQHVTFSGGEPFEQASVCRDILLKLKKFGKNDFWAYTGYVWEELIDKNSKIYSKDKFDFLLELDILVDGKFDISKKSMNLKYRGSSNQRIIKVKDSLDKNKVITLY